MAPASGLSCLYQRYRHRDRSGHWHENIQTGVLFAARWHAAALDWQENIFNHNDHWKQNISFIGKLLCNTIYIRWCAALT